MFGFIFITIGIVLLLKNLGLISGDIWGMIWPALLIIFGISLVIKKGDAAFFWEECCGFRKRKVKDDKEVRNHSG